MKQTAPTKNRKTDFDGKADIIGLCLCVGMLLAYVLPTVFAMLITKADISKDAMPMILLFCSALLSFAKNIFPFLFFTKKLSVFKGEKINRKVSPMQSIVFSAFALSLCIVLNIVSLPFGGVERSTPAQVNPVYIVLSYVCLAVIPALNEELIFRKVIAGGICGGGTVFAAVASSLLFAVLHQNFAVMPYTFLCGIVLCLLYFKTHSLFCCICVHALSNAIAVTNSFMNDNKFAVVVYICAAVLLLLCIVYFAARREKVFVLEKKGGTAKSLKAFFSKPLVVFAVLTAVLLTALQLL